MAGCASWICHKARCVKPQSWRVSDSGVHVWLASRTFDEKLSRVPLAGMQVQMLLAGTADHVVGGLLAWRGSHRDEQALLRHQQTRVGIQDGPESPLHGGAEEQAFTEWAVAHSCSGRQLGSASQKARTISRTEIRNVVHCSLVASQCVWAAPGLAKQAQHTHASRVLLTRRNPEAPL